MTDAITVTGLVKTFGQTRALDGLDLSVRDRRGARLPRPERRREDHHHPRPARPAARRRRYGPAARRRPVARRRHTAPAAGLRARRRDAVAQPVRRRGHRPARPAARRRSTASAGPTCWSASTSTRRKKGRTYSKGNRQKVALVAALASDVELLLLDEPTSGLDPLMEEVFRQVIREEQQRDGRTVLLSSHILAEVEALCDRVTIIREGRAVETGTPRRAAAPDPHLDPRRAGRTGRRPGRPARRARPAGAQRARQLRRGHRRARRRAAAAHRRRRARA